MSEAPEDPPLGNDERPNSGLREGDISHAEVNAALRAHEKTIVFGQQNRLRAGVLLEDEKLRRFHAGHQLVKFFYGAMRQLPEYLVDALLHWGVSVTMVKSPDLLVFHHVREHQSFHTGRTRKTLYMPELALKEAYDKGYDYWAISEVIIQESWPLLDYLLIVEFVRRAQQRLREYYTLGRGFVRNTFLTLNRHLKHSEVEPDNEFNEFLDHYHKHFYNLSREVIDADPYEWTDAIFDEGCERFWTNNKLYVIKEAFNYPTYYNIDRDIIHPAAFGITESRSLPVAPETIADIQHDLGDVARFGVGVQTKTEVLLDMLVERGAPGIKGFVDMGWGEGVYYGGNYYPAVAFKRRLLHYSSWPEEGKPGSIAQDFGYLLQLDQIEELHQQFTQRKRLPFRRKVRLLFRLIGLGGDLDGAQLLFERDAALEYTQDDDGLLVGLMEVLYDHYLQMDRNEPDFERFLMLQVLRKLDRHPRYHDLIVSQYQELSGGRVLVVRDNAREHIERLQALIPERPMRLSYDPQRLRARLHLFEQQSALDGSNPGLLTHLAGVLLRLDRVDNYAQLVEEVRLLGEVAEPVCREIVEQIAAKDIQRQSIRQAALELLQGKKGGSMTQATGPPPMPKSLLESFYKVIDRPLPEDRLQPLIGYMRDEELSKTQVLHALERRGDEISPAHHAVFSLLFGIPIPG